MKISLKQLVQSYGVLQVIASQSPDDAKLGYRLGRVYDSAQSEFTEFIKTRDKYLERYGQKVAGPPTDGQAWTFEDPEKLAEFNAEIEPLLEQEIEIWGDPWKLAELEGHPCDTCKNGAPKLKLTGEQYALLGWLIKE